MKRGGEVGTGINTGLNVVLLIKREDEYGNAENLGFKKNDSTINTGAVASKYPKAVNKKLIAVAVKRDTPGI